eukprot:Hpha_TRINITY_DN16540_c0_g7::TRINITY_DN16540_c0_g7_i1::g.134967::m.134967
MAPLLATVFALKTGSTTGFATGVLSVTWQQLTSICCAEKAVSFAEPEDEEEEVSREGKTTPTPPFKEKPLNPAGLISVKNAVECFVVGAVVGTLAGGVAWRYTIGKHAPHAWFKAIRGIIVGEVVFLPVVLSCVMGTARQVEDALPVVFVVTMVTMGGGLLVFEGLRQYHVIQSGTYGAINAGDIRRAVWYMGAPATAFLLVLFAAKMGEFQRQKELMFNTRRVRIIQRTASYGGQIAATVCAGSAVALPWIGALTAVPWFMPSCIISPMFLYCTSLNIENGVMSREVTAALAGENPEDVQQRRSTMQILPVGLLPFAWTKGRGSPIAVKIAFGAFALLCASAYIGCQVVPWSIYLRRQRLRIALGGADGHSAEGILSKHRASVVGCDSVTSPGLARHTTDLVASGLGIKLDSKGHDNMSMSPDSVSRRKSVVNTLDGEQC